MSNSISTARFCLKCQAETERHARGQCKPCTRATNAAWTAANPEREKAYRAAYRAANPDKGKARSAAWREANPDKMKATNAAYSAANRAQRKAANATRYEANPERQKAIAAAWQAANPEAMRIIHQNRRARKHNNGGTLSKGLSTKLFALQRGKCACCSLPLGTNFHLDHIMPLTLGGPNVDSNMQLLRQRCNQQKHAKHPVDFMQQRGFLL